MPSRPPVPSAPDSSAPSARRAAGRHGFSFIEILFAVAVMGLGFIMIAAVFPVGLQQTKLNMDETSAAANARGMMYQLNQLAQATVQYKNFGAAFNASNFTSLFPVTYGGVVPPAGSGAGQLAPGKTIILTGSVRSFRDPRPFPDAPAAAPADVTLRREAMWNKMASGFLDSSDARNGSVLLYRRDLVATNEKVAGVDTVVPRPSANAQIIVINVQANAQASYTTADVQTNVPAPTPVLYNLEPRPVAVLVSPNDAESNWTIAFDTVASIPAALKSVGSSAPSNTAAYTQAYAAVSSGAVAEGMFVVVADDNIKNSTIAFKDVGRLNGHIYRVGVRRPDLDNGGRAYYQIAPGYEPALDPGDSGQLNDTDKDDIVGLGSLTANLAGGTGTFGGVAFNGTNIQYNPALAYIVGRGVNQPGYSPTAASDFGGTAQDVGVYTTFLSIPAGQ